MLIKPRKWIVGLPWVCSCGKAHYVTEEDRRKNFIVCEHCGKFDILFPGIQKANKILKITLIVLAIIAVLVPVNILIYKYADEIDTWLNVIFDFVLFFLLIRWFYKK